MNQYGKNSIEMYEKIAELLQNDKESERNDQYYHSVVNAQFNCAKAYSKIYSLDKQIRIEGMVKSLKKYTWIRDFIKNEIAKKGPLAEEFEKELMMCEEMVEMLPNKIDKINNNLL